VHQDLKQLKQHLPLLDYLLRSNWTARRVGYRSEFVGLCPFHAETQPSFYVNAAKSLFYCHGCGRGGDLARARRGGAQGGSRGGAGHHSRGGRVGEEDARIAKFALCETADDLVGNLPWPSKETWLQHSLVLQFFHTQPTGAGFYEALNQILAKPEAHYDLLELMHACLSLGFEGPRIEQSLSQGTKVPV